MTGSTPRHPVDERASNADDPTADRVAAYPEAGELGSPQDPPAASDGPTPPQPAGADAAVLATGASGGGLAGPVATDAPGGGAGLPGPGGVDAQRAPGAETGLGPDARDAGAVDRMDR